LCTYPRRNEQSVLHCAEFEGETLRSAARSPASPASRPPYTASETPPLGLCANCGLYADCRYPKAEGGVWQCDEYR
jgi:hypothetical protein